MPTALPELRARGSSSRGACDCAVALGAPQPAATDVDCRAERVIELRHRARAPAEARTGATTLQRRSGAVLEPSGSTGQHKHWLSTGGQGASRVPRSHRTHSLYDAHHYLPHSVTSSPHHCLRAQPQGLRLLAYPWTSAHYAWRLPQARPQPDALGAALHSLAGTRRRGDAGAALGEVPDTHLSRPGPGSRHVDPGTGRLPFLSQQPAHHDSATASVPLSRLRSAEADRARRARQSPGAAVPPSSRS